jgi:hypothetical protein
VGVATTALQRLLTPTPKKVAGLGLYVLGIFLCCFFVPNVPSPGARAPPTRCHTGIRLERLARPLPVQQRNRNQAAQKGMWRESVKSVEQPCGSEWNAELSLRDPSRAFSPTRPGGAWRRLLVLWGAVAELWSYAWSVWGVGLRC